MVAAVMFSFDLFLITIPNIIRVIITCFQAEVLLVGRKDTETFISSSL